MLEGASVYIHHPGTILGREMMRITDPSEFNIENKWTVPWIIRGLNAQDEFRVESNKTAVSHLKLNYHLPPGFFQFSSVQLLCPTPCNPMDHSTPGFPVHHQLPDLTQTHIHQVGDAIQPSHPRSSPFPSTFNLSQHQESFQMRQFFATGGQSTGVSASASVLPMNTQDWFPLGWTGWISLQPKGLSRVFSSTTVQKHQSLSPQLSL